MSRITAPAVLSEEGLRRALAEGGAGRPLHVFGEVDSTNARLRAMARAGAPAGTVVVADGQTAGHGRRGQPWFSPAGVNLYASVLLRPRLGPRQVPIYSFVASLALTDALAEAGVRAGIKWPNDVLVDGKKVAGTLSECGMRGDRVEYVILGVGVNVNVDAEVLRTALGAGGRFATSLAAVTGRELDRGALCAGWLRHLDAWLDVWERRGPEAVRRAWADREILTGRRVEVRRDGERFEGRVRGVDAAGSLVVEDTLGHHHALTTEEVRLHD